MVSHFYRLGARFERCVEENSSKVALRQLTGSVTYRELADDAARLANLLVRSGHARGDVIAIAHNKHRLSYSLMLAALQVGVAYVCLDSESPLSRNRKILERSGAAALYLEPTDPHHPLSNLASVMGLDCRVLSFESLGAESTRPLPQAAAAATAVDGETIAYIMFTSGSTGEPKGVAVTHQNVLHFLAWSQTRFEVVPEDNFANLSPMYFDNSVFDFYTALFAGASLSSVPRGMLQSPYELVGFLEEMRCTIWFSVPSLLIYMSTMKAFTARSMGDMRLLIFGGEGYPKKELAKLFGLFGDRAQLVNVYGPTECTCICSAYSISSLDLDDLEGIPPLGVLNPNFDYAIIDQDGTESEYGELLLMGPNVSAGYFNDPERTAQSFFRWPTPDRFMKHVYRTGDMVRLVDGLLHFEGRVDNQIKHMGYRIELEEIETCLGTFPGVVQAAAVYRRESASYGRILAFVATDAAIQEADLMAHARETLPTYMVPSRITPLRHLPKNANGKIDRQALIAGGS